MIRPLSCGFVMALALAATHGRASACINDKELPNHEREFRSNYNGKPAPQPPPPAAPDYVPIYGGGAALLVAAAGLVVARGRSARG